MKMNLDTYKEYDNKTLIKLCEHNYEVLKLYRDYENEAIRCQSFYFSSITSKEQLLLLSKNIFYIIDIIKLNLDKSDVYYIDKLQLIVNCRWILYNIICISYNTLTNKRQKNN